MEKDDTLRHQRPGLLFLHANGYPGGVYRQFLQHLSPVFDITAVDRIGARPEHAPAQGWQRMRREVERALSDLAAAAPLTVVGHSMGGYLAAMVAACARHPVSAVVLVESPLVLGWRGAVLSAAKLSGATWRVGPAPVAARRRHYWHSREEARAHLAAKHFVQRWAPGVLDDFIRDGLTEHPGGGVTLTIPREAERAIYATIAHREAIRAVRALRARGVPAHFIAGRDSEELRLAGRDANRRFWGEHWHELPTGHLVPMEAPQACAEKVLELLRDQTASRPGRLTP
ncbi:alpha/beta fold hydrolase [Methyloversatilis thermotolerans]|uniref:alpha/beta fold hydrolase n=1 Tax=Methyloversatilis thermotolerans TaxID=1346290 RepID=UPI00035F3B7F|nr:alpha/beta hydrolase [Methyloversatilis thermotolerans]